MREVSSEAIVRLWRSLGDQNKCPEELYRLSGARTEEERGYVCEVHQEAAQEIVRLTHKLMDDYEAAIHSKRVLSQILAPYPPPKPAPWARFWR